MAFSIEIDGLQKYYGSAKVLHGVTLDVPAGQILGYIGPNGAGKTTTVKILTGMLDDFEGTARICGLDVRAEPVEVKKRIGLVPESAVLYEALTPRNYLRFVGLLHGLDRKVTDYRAEELMEVFDLRDVMSRPISTFSKGMRQKVLIVSGLLHNPDVVFLDEPLSGLDADSVIVVKEIIVRLAKRGKTVFYCSHVMDVVERICDRIVIIDDGRVIADGSFEQLQESDKSRSLERIFTQLTGASGHGARADRFVQAVSTREIPDD